MSSCIVRRLAAAAAAGLLCFAVACSSDEERLARHLESASQYATAGKSKEALIELRSALQLDPKNADVNFRIAQILQQDGKWSEAAFFFRETVRLDPSRSDAALAEVKLLLFDDPERAKQLIEQVLEREPSNSLAYIRRSELALAAGDADAALEAALTATELQPEDGLAWMQVGIANLARVHQTRVRGETVPEDLFEATEKAFQRSDQLFDGDHMARRELARLYSVWPEHAEQAEATYRAAVEVADPGEQRGQVAAAALAYAKAIEDTDLTRWALDEIVQNIPESLESWGSLAALEEQREAGAGEAVYRRLMTQRGDDALSHVAFARFLAGHDRFEEAVAHLEQQAEQGNQAPIALEEVVALYVGKGQLEPARSAYSKLQRDFPGHARTALAAGRLALAENRFEDAAEALRRYTGSEENAEGQRLLALAELGRRNTPAAVAAVDRAIQLAGTEPPAVLLRLKAQIHRQAGDWAQVIVTMNQLARVPDLQTGPADQLLYARALYQTGKGALGKQILEQMLTKPEPPAAVYLEFAALESEREPERARAYLDKVLAEAPRNEIALRLRIAGDLQAGRKDDALQRLDTAAEAGPLSPTLLLLRAQVLAAQQDYDRAEAEARRAFAAAPNLTPALDLLAQIYVAQNRLPEAIASFEEADKVGALPASGQVLLARLQLSVGNQDAAQALYERALAARSDLPGAQNDLAWLLAEKGTEIDRALALAQQATQTEPENPDFVDTLGYVYLRKGLNEPALEQFRYALELAERSNQQRPGFHHHLGLALRALGRQADAAEAFARALEIDASFPQAEDARRELEAAKTAAASTPG